MKKNRRRVTITVTPETLYHLEQMAAACQQQDLGHVVDKLVRDHQMAARSKNKPTHKGGAYNVWK